MPQPMDTPSQQHCLARALYDNIPDTPDELHFRKGDTLIVLEQNTANIEGWWLCSLRGKQGICPANRLRLIPGVFEEHGQQSRGGSPYNMLIEHGDPSYLQRQGKRRSWHVHPNQVITPRKFNDVYLYDMPPSRSSPHPPSAAPGGVSPPPIPPDDDDSYDVPPPAVPIGCPRCSPSPSAGGGDSAGEAYDVPRPLLGHPNHVTPSSSASSLATTDCSPSSSNRSSSCAAPDYDVPRPHPKASPAPISIATPPPKELPLELNSALENLQRLQADATAAISKLLGFVAPRWRARDRLEANLMDVKLAVTRLRASLHDLADFGEGALGNAARASDKNLAGKLAPLVSALRKSDSLVQEASDRLAAHDWSLDVLSRPAGEDRAGKPDELEQLVACSRALTEDVRQMASFIQGNGLLLFRTERAGGGGEWADEYDYVSFESKEAVCRGHQAILRDLPPPLQQGYDECVRHADQAAAPPAAAPHPQSADDRRLVAFYASQAATHHGHLTHAVDALLRTVELSQPPAVFLAHGKFVVLSAHRLVLIGDTVRENVSCRAVREAAQRAADGLADALAAAVGRTKQAAARFPSVKAVQEMVDAVVDVSHAAREVKGCLLRAAAAAEPL